MRFGFALMVLCLLSMNSAKADTFRVSTAEFPESKAITNLLKEVYRQLGHDIEVVYKPAKRSLVDVNSGASDAELARIIGTETEYPNLVRVEEPVFALSFSAIVNAKSNIWLSSWSELKKHSLGYPRGYRILDIRTRELNATAASSSDAIAKMVKGGRFEVGLVITSDADRLASQNPEIVVLKPPIESVTLYHYLNVKHRRLVPALEEILIKFNDSGQAKELLFGSNAVEDR